MQWLIRHRIWVLVFAAILGFGATAVVYFNDSLFASFAYIPGLVMIVAYLYLGDKEREDISYCTKKW